jgi:hypothetical protein
MIIAARFNGPPGSGNGGYCSGLFAEAFRRADSATEPDAVEVTLRRPPPLETELTETLAPVPIAATTGLSVAVLRVFHDKDLVAEATANAISDDEMVPAVPFAAAVTASASYYGFVSHPFPTCFVCGPQREPGDGMRLFPGRLPDRRTATPFVVPADISPALVWAALDCPGGWAVPLEDRPYVLGRLAARIDALPEAGAECVVMGHMIGEDGRKAFVNTTLYSPTGAVLARARATWVAL